MVTGMDLSSDSEASSDEELQRAFAAKELIPGTFSLIPYKEKVDINNITGLKDKLKEIKINLPWIERLDMNNEVAVLAPELAKKLEAETSQASFVENEFKREIQFYRQAQAAVLEGIPKLHELGVSTRRPVDYFAQMAKSDEHMKKVRELLLNKQTVIERKEKLKKLRELKKYGKKVQQEVLQKRNEEKKEMMESVKKFRKTQKNRFEETDSKPSRNKKDNKQNKKQLARKEFKDKKFGFGGQKKKMKFNDRESSADVSDFKRGKFKGKPKGGFNNKNKGKGRGKY